MKTRFLLGSVALPALAFAIAAPAYAQSTGTDTVEETIVVTGQVQSKGGLIKKETIPKTRSTVDQKYLKTQLAGQTVFQSINLLPGVNFTNTDPYGSSGGNVRLRSFDGNRVSLTADGTPLNDTGNYAIFPNQQFDAEIVDHITVNLGTTDVDSPTASATGGTINIATRRPSDDFGVQVTGSVGEDSYRRVFLGIDTGKLGDNGPTAFLTGSYQKYDKFKGFGELEKKQFNGKVYEAWGNQGDFVSVAAHYNENRNAAYRNVSLAQIAFYGKDYDYLPSCTRTTPGAGAQNDAAGTALGGYLAAADNPANAVSCTNYFGNRLNPSNTGNIRIQSSFALTDALRLTVDPSFQYVLANGGTQTTVIPETDGRLRGRNATGTGFALAGVDLNGDGDLADSIRLYTPSTTNTYRYGVTASLIYDLTDTQTIRVAYTLDYGRHRQTGDWGILNPDGSPENVFGGRDGVAVVGANGNVIQNRDRFSIAELNQVALSYNGTFMDGRLKLAIGVRAPFFQRDLNQNCFSQDGTSNVYCTTQLPTATLANGNVTFAGAIQTSGSPYAVGTQFIPQYKAVKKYDDVLPNVGISYKLDDASTIYASFAQGLSAPRTDSLYTPKRNAVTGAIDLTGVDPEKTNAFDLGYRYQGDKITASTALWYTKYDNRIVNSFDDILGIFVDRNIGKVDLYGVDGEVAVQPLDGLTLYASASYIHSELKNNIALSATQFFPTAGKKLVETPDWTLSLRAQYEVSGFVFGFQGKYVGDRYSTDVNDEIAPSYTTVDADIRYTFDGFGLNGAYIQLNALNIFDEDYLGSIPTSQTNSKTVSLITTNGVAATRAGSAVLYSVGAPRTFQATIGFKF